MPSTQKDLIFAVFVVSITLFILAGLIVLLVYNYFKVKSRRQQDILKAIFEAQETERTRIAEDLHDDIGGKLSALKLQNELLIAEGLTARAQEHAYRNSGIIDTVVKDIRKIVRNQASKYLHENGLSHELRTLCDQYSQLRKLEIRLDLNDAELPFRADFKVAIFRILQELLHNSVKHSGASVIQIRFVRTYDVIEVFYSDNGKGFEVVAHENNGMGLSNIRTRTQLYGGVVNFESSPGQETSCRMVFPWKELSG